MLHVGHPARARRAGRRSSADLGSSSSTSSTPTAASSAPTSRRCCGGSLRVARHHGARAALRRRSATVGEPRRVRARAVRPRARRGRRRRRAAPERQLAAAQARRRRPTPRRRGCSGSACGAGLRTIAFTQGAPRHRAHAPVGARGGARARAAHLVVPRGFLPEERREIERRLFDGRPARRDLDLGARARHRRRRARRLHPGRIPGLGQIATWQRARPRRARAGEGVVFARAAARTRSTSTSCATRSASCAAVRARGARPENPEIAAAHLPCAAAELPLRARRAVARRARAWSARSRSPHERGAAARERVGRRVVRGAPQPAPRGRACARPASVRDPPHGRRATRRPRPRIGTIGGGPRDRRVPRGRDLPAPRAAVPASTELDLERRNVRSSGAVDVDLLHAPRGREGDRDPRACAPRPVGNVLAQAGPRARDVAQTAPTSGGACTART